MNSEILYWLIGVVAGAFVQLTISRIKHNGDWHKMKRGKQIALSATGSISAAVAGLIYLSGLDHDIAETSRLLYRMWAWQAFGAIGGAEALEQYPKVPALINDFQKWRQGK
jgi:hypothetical protein